ncbi:zf-HC2 domain-containing protein [Oribacterium sp. WCC10]|uniref:zf-HC2 domain-containing protein n=1 Tax=Oribacterium sp. WCC10 TaxID=1855343 RepID=UPI0008EA8A9B|nr:zf-HC2 domain-containing protein [Oribacterium sp. WCC10]SFG07276.1 Putative zinc-finger [Oribacterium sp. WCC10]
MTCLEARKRIYDYLKNKLPDAELKEFIEHVSKCDACMEEMRITHMVYSGVAELDSDEDSDSDLDIDGALKRQMTESRFYLLRLFVIKVMAMSVDTIVFWAVLIIFIMQMRIWLL